MSTSLFDSALFGGLLPAATVREQLGDAAHVRAMLDVEAALARAQGRLGLIPADAARQVDEVARALCPDPATLAAGTAAAGVPVPALVAALRAAVGGEAAAFVHRGATSQDIVDTALVLRLRVVLQTLATTLEQLIASLARQAQVCGPHVCAARTRTQQATPTSLGLKVAAWLDPLLRHRERLCELRPRLLVVQLGGASGNLAAFAPAGVDLMEALAVELELEAPAMPWHGAADRLVEFGHWLALLTGSLGRMGADLLALGQSEVGELRAGSAGGSSTMPQKANPVGAEMLLALARHNAGLVATLHQGLPQSGERDGAHWTLGWLTLPPMITATAAALAHAQLLADTLAPDPRRMRENMERSHGLLLAEAASFALARHMPLPQAQALVKRACTQVASSGEHLIDVLASSTDVVLDWEALRDPAGSIGAADALVRRVLAQV